MLTTSANQPNSDIIRSGLQLAIIKDALRFFENAQGRTPREGIGYQLTNLLRLNWSEVSKHHGPQLLESAAAILCTRVGTLRETWRIRRVALAIVAHLVRADEKNSELFLAKLTPEASGVLIEELAIRNELNFLPLSTRDLLWQKGGGAAINSYRSKLDQASQQQGIKAAQAAVNRYGKIFAHWCRNNSQLAAFEALEDVSSHLAATALMAAMKVKNVKVPWLIPFFNRLFAQDGLPTLLGLAPTFPSEILQIGLFMQEANLISAALGYSPKIGATHVREAIIFLDDQLHSSPQGAAPVVASLRTIISYSRNLSQVGHGRISQLVQKMIEMNHPITALTACVVLDSGFPAELALVPAALQANQVVRDKVISGVLGRSS